MSSTSAGTLLPFLTRRDAVAGVAALLGSFNLHGLSFAKSSAALVSELMVRARQEHLASTCLVEFHLQERARLAAVRMPEIIWTKSVNEALQMVTEQNQPSEGADAGNFWETDDHVDAQPLRAGLAIKVLDRAIELCRDEADEADLFVAETRLHARLLRECASAGDVKRMRDLLQQIHASQTSLAVRVSLELSRIILLSDEDSHEENAIVRRALATFGARESGLSATWEVPGAILCLARGHGR